MTRGNLRLGIIELLTRIGEDNFTVQNLVESATNFKAHKKGGTAVTFITDGITPGEVFSDKPRHRALILWLPTALVDKALADHDAEADAKVGA